MTYEVFMYIYRGGAILATIMFIVSVVLFFVLKIPAVIGDLSGATARKGVERIRNQNEASGEKGYKSSAVNKSRGKLTDKISHSGKIQSNPSDKLGFGMKTEKISTQRLDVDDTSNETTVLNVSNETTVLSASNETTVLSSDSGETTVLNGMNNFNETTVLSQNMLQPGSVGFGDTGKLSTISAFFEIEQEITFIHTQEVI